MKIREPIPHWNNFTLPELRDILGHCVALEKLGIAQDEEMMLSIERDITLRENVHCEPKPTKIRRQTIQNRSLTNAITKQTQPRSYILEQTA